MCKILELRFHGSGFRGSRGEWVLGVLKPRVYWAQD